MSLLLSASPVDTPAPSRRHGGFSPLVCLDERFFLSWVSRFSLLRSPLFLIHARLPRQYSSQQVAVTPCVSLPYLVHSLRLSYSLIGNTSFLPRLLCVCVCDSELRLCCCCAVIIGTTQTAFHRHLSGGGPHWSIRAVGPLGSRSSVTHYSSEDPSVIFASLLPLLWPRTLESKRKK